MPYSSEKEAHEKNPSLRSLSLADANRWSRIFDALKAQGKSPSVAAGIAWVTLRKHKKKEG